MLKLVLDPMHWSLGVILSLCGISFLMGSIYGAHKTRKLYDKDIDNNA